MGATRPAQSAWLPVLRTLGTRPWYGKQFYVSGASPAACLALAAEGASAPRIDVELCETALGGQVAAIGFAPAVQRARRVDAALVGGGRALAEQVGGVLAKLQAGEG